MAKTRKKSVKKVKLIKKVNSPNPVDVHVGRRLRALRLEKGLSQQALGDTLGSSAQLVGKYEKGDGRISASVLWSLSEIFSVHIGHFYEGLHTQKKLKKAAIFDLAEPGDVQFICNYLVLPRAVKSRARALVIALCDMYRK